jgi:hypothetical protein
MFRLVVPCKFAATPTVLLDEKSAQRQRITHITEEFNFLSESDKDWIMGRSILQRLI